MPHVSKERVIKALYIVTWIYHATLNKCFPYCAKMITRNFSF